MRILFSGGGTGGGTYPAIAVANALKQQHPDAHILWIGSSTGIERDLVERAGLDFVGVPSGPLVGVGLRSIPSSARIVAGTIAAMGHIRRFKPDAMLMTGGWPVLPATLASRLLGVPICIYLPDLEPGGTIRITSRFADVIAANFPESAQYFDDIRVEACGYPLRADVLRAAGFSPTGEPLDEPPDSRAQAVERFGLEPGTPTVLVFGGSKGTSTINEALLNGLAKILQHGQALHITGREHWETVQKRAAGLAANALSGTIPVQEEKRFGRVTVDLDQPITSRYHPHDYLHTEDMALALATADLVVSRAGAGTLGEFPLFGLPAVVIPLARAWRYQQVNADYLVSRGAALRLADEALDEQLTPTILRLLEDAETRAEMRRAALSLRRPDAAACIVEVLLGLT